MKHQEVRYLDLQKNLTSEHSLTTQKYLHNSAPAHQAMCYMHPVEEALRAGKLKVYTLGKPVDIVAVNKEKSDLLNQLKMICNRIIAEEEAEYARIAKGFYAKNPSEKNLARLTAGAEGVGDYIVGAITYSFNVAQVFIPQVRLATAGVNIGLHIQENGLGKINDISDAARQFTTLANVVYEGFMKDVKDVVGFDIRDTSKQDIDKAIDVFNILKGDPTTFQILSNFAERLANSQHELEYVRNGSGILFGLIVSSVLFYLSGGTAAGAAAASLGLIIKVTSAAKNLIKKLGEILVRIIEVTAKLPKAIKRKSRRHAEKRNPIISKLEDEVHSQKNKRKNEKSKKEREEENSAEKSTDPDINAPQVTSGYGKKVKMDGHKIYDPNSPPVSTNPNNQYRFSDPSHRSTGGDVYFGKNVATSYQEVRKDIKGKSLYVANVEVDNILDLTDPKIAKDMNIDVKKLSERVDNPIQKKRVYDYTNDISNQAYDAGYNGVLYPSSRKIGGNNNAMVLFEGRYDQKNINPILDKRI